MAANFAYSIVNKDEGSKIIFGVTKFPGRKNFCLYCQEGSCIEPLAYFSTKDKALKFQKILNAIFPFVK